MGRPAVMVSAILAARHRTFVLVVTSLFVLFVFPMHNKFLLLLLLPSRYTPLVITVDCSINLPGCWTRAPFWLLARHKLVIFN